jgi:uncharacterized protein YbjT (DUF2867 family)
MMTQNSILIAGGYGVVGRQVSTLIRQRYPDLPLIIAGRNPEKAQALAHYCMSPPRRSSKSEE